MSRRVRVLVAGVVQGVNFRAFTRREAERLGLSGWVRNLADGRVEADVEGDPGTVDRLLAKLRTGPPISRVDRVDVTEMSGPGGAAGFEIRSTAEGPEGSE
jgi:acylphosphatase